MPLVRIDVIEGRNAAALGKLADTLHATAVEAFNLPERDRFQVITEHKAHQMVVQDIGLGFERSRNIVVVQITTTPRSLAARRTFYRLAAKKLQAECGIDPQDLVINLITATESDWSFGGGVPQFLTGAL